MIFNTRLLWNACFALLIATSVVRAQNQNDELRSIMDKVDALNAMLKPVNAPPPIPSMTQTPSDAVPIENGVQNRLRNPSPANPTGPLQPQVSDPSGAGVSIEDFQSVLSQAKALRKLREEQSRLQSKTSHPNLVSVDSVSSGNQDQIPNTNPSSNGAQASSMTSEPKVDSDDLPDAVIELPPPASNTPNTTSVTSETIADDEFDARKRILDAPADPLLLAHSLYQVGNFESAQAVLAQIDESTLNEADQSWTILLRALILRRSGRIDQAIALLRKAANERREDYKTEAKWWLDHYERIRARNQPNEEILNKATQVLEEARSYANPN